MAKYNLLLPKMGESVAEATVIRWNKAIGDLIEIDDAVLEIATDKVDSEVPSPVAGKLVLQLYKENEVVQVGAVIGVIEIVGDPEPVKEQLPPPVKETVFVEDPLPAVPPPLPEPIPGTEQLQPKPQPVVPPVMNHAVPRFYSPLIRSIAAQEGISFSELDQIKATGSESRLTKEDLFEYIAYKNAEIAKAQHERPVEQPPVEALQSESVKIPEAQPIAKSQPHETVEHTQVEPSPESVPKYKEEEIHPVTAEEPVQTFTPTEEHPLPQTADREQPEKVVPLSEQPVVAAKEEPVKPIEQPHSPPVVTEPEVQPVAERKEAPVAGHKAEPAHANPPPVTRSSSLNGGDEIIEMDRMRKLIAEHMVMSVQTSPHVTSFIEADVTSMVLWRKKIKDSFEQREGTKITYTPMFIEAVARAIKDMPMINVSVSGTQIIKKKDINIGMATALPTGNLIVPVIRRADELSMIGLTKAVNDLANRARTNKLQPDDIREGTFTITNIGSFGNDMGTPIINQPQAAILAVGVIKKKPAVIETSTGDVIAVRHMMFLSLSYDHRVIDGSLGGSFLRRVADYLEQWDMDRPI